MIPMFAAWVDGVRYGMEVQQVIAARLFRLGRADLSASVEATQMITEKVAAFFEGQAAGAQALSRGASLGTAIRKAQNPYRRRVRANRKRLYRKS
jgi:hypothetical protein